MTNTLQWLFWFSGAAVTSLASADLLLLDTQKKWISDRATEFWDWLDDQRELRYLAYLRKFRWQRFVVILFATIALIMTLVIGYGVCTGGFHDAGVAGIPPYFEHYLLGSYVGCFVAALWMARTGLASVLSWVTKTERSWAYLWRSTLVLLVTTVAVILAFFVFVAFSGDHRTAELSSTGNAQELITNLYSFSSPVTAFLYGLCGSLGITFLFLILISWMLVVLPVLFVVLLTILFRVAQSLAVRVAENPKGPQYVLGVMLGGAGTVVRYFTSFMAA
jgi:hypothetical protein